MENSSAGQDRYDGNAEDGLEHINFVKLALDVRLYIIKEYCVCMILSEQMKPNNNSSPREKI